MIVREIRRYGPSGVVNISSSSDLVYARGGLQVRGPRGLPAAAATANRPCGVLWADRRIVRSELLLVG